MDQIKTLSVNFLAWDKPTRIIFVAVVLCSIMRITELFYNQICSSYVVQVSSVCWQIQSVQREKEQIIRVLLRKAASLKSHPCWDL